MAEASGDGSCGDFPWLGFGHLYNILCIISYNYNYTTKY